MQHKANQKSLKQKKAQVLAQALKKYPFLKKYLQIVNNKLLSTLPPPPPSSHPRRPSSFPPRRHKPSDPRGEGVENQDARQDGAMLRALEYPEHSAHQQGYCDHAQLHPGSRQCRKQIQVAAPTHQEREKKGKNKKGWRKKQS